MIIEASSVSRKTMKKMGTENRFFVILGDGGARNTWGDLGRKNSSSLGCP